MNTMNYRLEETITELSYTDDTALLSTKPKGLNNLVQAANHRSAAYTLLR